MKIDEVTIIFTLAGKLANRLKKEGAKVREYLSFPVIYAE